MSTPTGNDPVHDEVLSGHVQAEDHKIEDTVRPKRMRDFAGQPQAKERMSISIQAAVKRAEALDHTLFYGPPGLGKTTLAQILARELDVGLRQTTGPVLERPGDLAALLTSLKSRDVLFIDEIHRLKPVVQEILYSAMEDFKIDIIIGEGPAATSMTLQIKPFTLVGATTRAGLVTGPLRDRFGIQERLDLYSDEDLQKIIERSARVLDIPCSVGGAKVISQRSRGTPRVANRLLRRTRDYAEVRENGRITAKVSTKALTMYNVHADGLNEMDRRLLRVLIERFGGGPAGVGALAAGLGEDRGTVEDVYEPFLLRAGFLLRTSRGRVAGPASYTALGLEPPAPVPGQPRLEGMEVH